MNPKNQADPSWNMWAVEDIQKNESGQPQPVFRLISESEKFCDFQRRQYDSLRDSKCIPIIVTIHEDQSPETKCTGFGIDYWGWIDTGDNKPRLIQNAWSLFSMQFAGGSYGETKAGVGKAYRLKIQKQY